MNKTIRTTLRIAQLKDAEAIAQVHHYSWQEMYKNFIPESILHGISMQDRIQYWHSFIQQGDTVLVCETEFELIGFVSLCTFRDVDYDPLTGEISDMYLHPSFLRLGLGTQLAKAALSELIKLGYERVSLWVLVDNSQARTFYESLGFTLTERTKMREFYEDSPLLKEVLYTKVL